MSEKRSKLWVRHRRPTNMTLSTTCLEALERLCETTGKTRSALVEDLVMREHEKQRT